MHTHTHTFTQGIDISCRRSSSSTHACSSSSMAASAYCCSDMPSTRTTLCHTSRSTAGSALGVDGGCVRCVLSASVCSGWFQGRTRSSGKLGLQAWEHRARACVRCARAHLTCKSVCACVRARGWTWYGLHVCPGVSVGY